MKAAKAVLVVATLGLACARAPVPRPDRPPPANAQLVAFRAADGVELHGYFYLPAGRGPGPFPAVLWNHGSERLPGWQPELAAFYNANGFAFFIPHRRGQGQSSAAGPYIADRQPSKLAMVASGASAGRKIIALHEEANHDVEAALAWLKARPDIDPGRIVMSGVSFGGIQTLLAAEKDLGVRAFVAFAPGAMSWRGVTGLDARLETAVQHAQAPVLIVQAQNDYNLGPSQVLGPLLEKAGKGRAVVFPAFGTTEQEGHGAFARRAEGTAVWGAMVLGFFREAIAR
ncbi:MAG TPA: CocE/NonD family hydrolase [Polyangia bacterium]|nr:CocE/NonD family hydrolase [Polyangia bacterium]